MNFRYLLGTLIQKCGYKITQDYRWPEVHGNLLCLGFSLLAAKKPGLIQLLQIGAFDGQMCDPVEGILQTKKVIAVLVEPQKEPYEQLVKRYADNPKIRVVNAAVAEADGTVTLYVPSLAASSKASLISHHHSRFGLKKSELRELTVPSITVASSTSCNWIQRGWTIEF
jgi:FkbM family methyltransferase